MTCNAPKEPISKDSIWNYKPWWCQPWSIVLTGVALVGGSWLTLHQLWVSGLVALPVLAWWVLFLAIYPRAMVESGMLDEYRHLTQAEDDGESAG